MVSLREQRYSLARRRHPQTIEGGRADHCLVIIVLYCLLLVWVASLALEYEILDQLRLDLRGCLLLATLQLFERKSSQTRQGLWVELQVIAELMSVVVLHLLHILPFLVSQQTFLRAHEISAEHAHSQEGLYNHQRIPEDESPQRE